MKALRRAAGGPFSERPHFSLAEIDRMCREELASVGLLPNAPAPIRIERFINKRFGVTPEYEELGAGLLGFTEFGKRGIHRIVISRALGSERTRVADRRIRTTMAHEAGHCLMHAHLFLLEDRPSLLPHEKQPRKIMCRDEGGARLRSHNAVPWHEFQANRAIGGLLLPQELVRQVAQSYMKPSGALGVECLPADARRTLTLDVSDVFDVNPIVAQIRIAELFKKGDAAQLSL